MNDKKSLKEFAKALKAARVDLGLTRSQLAECLGCAAQTVAHWEAGSYFPGGQFEPLIAKDLGVDVSEYREQSKRRIEKRRSKANKTSRCENDKASESNVEEPPRDCEGAEVSRVPVYVGRVLEALEKYGYYKVPPTAILGLMDAFAKVLVGDRHHKLVHGPVLEVPSLLPESISHGSNVFLYADQDELRATEDILEFDWSKYLESARLQAYIVFDKDEETAFFKE